MGKKSCHSFLIHRNVFQVGGKFQTFTRRRKRSPVRLSRPDRRQQRAQRLNQRHRLDKGQKDPVQLLLRQVHHRSRRRHADAQTRADQRAHGHHLLGGHLVRLGSRLRHGFSGRNGQRLGRQKQRSATLSNSQRQQGFRRSSDGRSGLQSRLRVRGLLQRPRGFVRLEENRGADFQAESLRQRQRGTSEQNDILDSVAGNVGDLRRLSLGQSLSQRSRRFGDQTLVKRLSFLVVLS